MKNIKNILKYLCKNNVKLRNRLFEQMQAVGNDRPGMTLGQFKNFIDQHVRHPQNIKVEIFEVSRNHGIMHVYCGKDQFNWQPNLPHVGFEMKDDIRYANTGKASQLLADIQAMIGAQADVVNTPLKLVSNDDKFDPYVFFEDQSDTLILVKPENAALDTKRLVQQKIEEGFNQMSNHNGTRNLTLDEIYEAMVHAVALPQDREILKSLIPDSEKDELLRRLQNQAGNNIAAARQAAQPAQPAQAAQPAAQAAQPAAQAAQQDGEENVNGMRIIEEVANNNINQIPAGRNFGYAVVMSPLTYDEFKAQLRAFPANIPARFTDKPVKFVHIDSGEARDPTHNALRYFFIWNPDGSFVWKQVNRKQSGVLKITDRISRVFFTMLRSPGAKWKSAVYRMTYQKVRNGEFEVVWGQGDAYIVKQNDAGEVVGVRPVDNRQAEAFVDRQNNPEAEPDKPAAGAEIDVVEGIKQRILNELVGKFAIDAKIVQPAKKEGDRDLTIVVGQKVRYDRNLRRTVYDGVNHVLTAEDADNLSKLYNDWKYTGNDQNILNTLKDVLNPENLKMPEIDFDVKRGDQGDDAFKQAQAEIDAALKPVQFVTADLVKDDINYEDRLPVEDVILHVRLPGADNRLLRDANAEAFLKKYGLFDGVAPAIQAAKKQYPDVKLVVTCNNPLRK